MKFGSILFQVNVSDFFTSYFQDGVRGIISCRVVLTPGECISSKC